MLKKPTLIITTALFSLCFLNTEAQNQGEVFLKKKEYKKAKDYYVKLLASGQTKPEAHYGLGKSHMGLEQYDDAIDHFQRAISVKNTESRYYHDLGEAYLQKLQTGNMFEKMRYAGQVKENYIKAVDLDPNNLNARVSLAYFYSEAPGIAGGSISKAKEQAKIVTDQNPIEGHELMSNIFIKDDEYEQAIQELKKLESAGVATEIVSYKIGRIYQDEEKYNLAFQSFERAVSLNNNYGPAYYQYARTGVFAKSNIDQSIRYMKKYLILEVLPGSPDWSSANWRLGMLYELKDNKPLAIAAYKEALKLNPKNKQAKEALEELD